MLVLLYILSQYIVCVRKKISTIQMCMPEVFLLEIVK